jgi:hypothetical protein
MLQIIPLSPNRDGVIQDDLIWEKFVALEISEGSHLVYVYCFSIKIEYYQKLINTSVN